MDGTFSFTSAPALFPASLMLLMTLSNAPTSPSPTSPLRSLVARPLSDSMAAVSGATAFDSSGSPLALSDAALSRL